MTLIKKFMRTAAVVGVAGLVSTAALAESIVSFNGPAGEAYIGRFIKGIKETAALKGYDIKVFEKCETSDFS